MTKQEYWAGVLASLTDDDLADPELDDYLDDEECFLNMMIWNDYCVHCHGGSVRWCEECWKTGSQKFAERSQEEKEKLMPFL